jgi:hypothetical protein
MLSLFIFLVTVILNGGRWNFNVGLIFISVMAKSVENFSRCLLACCTFLFDKDLFNLFAHLLILLFVLLVFNFWTSLHFLDVNPTLNEYLV